MSVHPVAATDVTFYSSNDILYYNPDDATNPCQTSDSATVIANLDGSDNAEKIWNFFVSENFTPEQVAGIMGNLEAESVLNPGAEEAAAVTSKGYGIAQWTGSRRDALEAAASRAGVPSNDLAFQLTFLLQEMGARTPNSTFDKYDEFANEVEAIKAQTAINDALVAFHHNFERSYLTNEPNPDEAVIRERGGITTPNGKRGAEFFYNTYSGMVASEGSDASTDCVDSSSEAPASFTEAVLSYAWPKYYSPNHLEMMPDYKKAVARAQGEGRYVGGGVYPGIDCGGFVTTLIYDSGFDKSYNSSARGGNTVSQRTWAENNWQTVGQGSEINVADLKPGDVAFSPGHTFVYVGQIDGFGSKIASASYSPSGTAWRTPMAGSESVTSGDVTWFRKG